MFKYLNQKINALYATRIDATGLAIFRIFWCLNFLGEVAEMIRFKELMFDRTPFVVPADINHGHLLWFWIAVIVLLMVGYRTTWMAIINYALTFHFMGSTKMYEYHMFHTFLIVNFLLIFVGSGKVWSIDFLLKKWKYSSAKFEYHPPRTVPKLSYLIIAFCGIGLVYFDSVFFKYANQLWQSGLAFWLPCSVPFAVHSDITPVLNMKWLSIGLSHLTLIFETLFIFIFFRKKWRWPVVLIGVGLHLGIMICYPIPWFAFGYMVLYILVVPVSTWKKCGAALKRKKSIITFYYDEECPLCAKTRMALSSIDLFGSIAFKGVQTHASNDTALRDIHQEKLLQDIHVVTNKGRVHTGINAYIQCLFALGFTAPIALILSLPGVKHLAGAAYRRIADSRETSRCTDDSCGYMPPLIPSSTQNIKLSKHLTIGAVQLIGVKMGLIALFLLQANSTYNSTAIQLLKEKIGIRHSRLEAKIQEYTEPCREFSKDFFGITGHTVFLDKHFNGYRHNIAVEYLGENGSPNIWLPIITPTGQPGDYQVGPTWARWTFRINGPNIQTQLLYKGIEDFTAFWMGKNHISFKHARFKIWVKTFDAPTGWKENHLREQMNKPWIDAGEVEWNEKKFETRITDIEAIP